MLECYWYLPLSGYIKVNTDGASRGNPGNAGWAAVYRDHNGIVIGTYVGGLGVATNYEAKSTAIVEGIAKAIEQGWLHIWVDTDSATAAKAFQTDNVLWKVWAKWDRIKLSNIELRITSSWREVNFAADHRANKGLGLNRGCKQWWNGKPPFLTQIENPELTYYRFLN
ncbi:hypothetical protein IFM89_007500 [Coptis chinensis]|uniref:RNase H type-1 domain-containing protein n=1 Tax=Coptis chinensis TaxID=261450 RepID=A0A835LKU0_9MAGN|nr:hypothetical protein IFM89_007500 [Coptis chinensis]